MIMTSPLRKVALTAHVAVSVGWAGALAVFLAHALASLASQDEQIVRAASLAMALTTWFVILPLALASLATGLVQALGTAWGLFRHYWIVFKLLLTCVATIVLLLKMGPINDLAHAAAQTAFSSADLVGLRTSLLVHAGGGLLLLLTVTTLAVCKPQGLTPYGTRKQREQFALLGREPGVNSDAGSTKLTPRWIKFVLGFVLVLIVLGALMMLGGEHGPGAHAPASLR